MQVKIISLNKAIELGLSKAEPFKQSGQGGLQPQFAFGAVGKIGSNEVLELHRINLKTKEKVILYENKEYRKEKQRLKVNEYAVDKKSDITRNPL